MSVAPNNEMCESNALWYPWIVDCGNNEGWRYINCAICREKNQHAISSFFTYKYLYTGIPECNTATKPLLIPPKRSNTQTSSGGYFHAISVVSNENNVVGPQRGWSSWALSISACKETSLQDFFTNLSAFNCNLCQKGQKWNIQGRRHVVAKLTISSISS